MEKLDLAKKYKNYYSAKAKPEMADIEEAAYISIKGKGDPSSNDFAARIQALYATAYSIKFICKTLNLDFIVPKLEGLWSFDTEKYPGLSMEEAPAKVPRSEWEYRLLIRMPDFVTQKQVEAAREQVVFQKNIMLANEIVFFTMKEGKCVQMLHIGPFEKEFETLKQIQEFTEKNQLKKNGLHHEIYLSDFRKTAPGNLKTILREPVK